jgi:hypothetical protein
MGGCPANNQIPAKTQMAAPMKKRMAPQGQTGRPPRLAVKYINENPAGWLNRCYVVIYSLRIITYNIQ